MYIACGLESLYELIKGTKPNFNKGMFKKIFISPKKEKLIIKINLRVEQMFKNGAIKEVVKFLKLKVKILYPFLIDFFSINIEFHNFIHKVYNLLFLRSLALFNTYN